MVFPQRKNFSSTAPDENNVEACSLHREAFPIDTSKETDQNRRAFLKTLAVASGALACSHAALMIANIPETPSTWREDGDLELGKNFNDMEEGDALVFHYPDHSNPALFIKTENNQWVAYSQKCTHLACPVVAQYEEKRLFCPCHNGAFSIESGEPIQGPPQRRLPRLKARIEGDGKIVITGRELST